MKHPPEDPESFRSVSEALGVSLSSVQAERLVSFGRLLRSRGVPLGIVARSDASRILERHVLDCLRAATVLGDARAAYDLGSGGGLPGMVVAIAAPQLRVGLVEVRRRRVSFLELAIDELGLANVRVLATRVEAVEDPVELCFARAFAPLPEAWAAAARLLVPGGRLVYFAGGGATPAEWGVRELPVGARLVEVRASPVLESSGPLVIMAQQ